MRATKAVRKTEGTHTLLKLHTDIKRIVRACNEFAVKIIHITHIESREWKGPLQIIIIIIKLGKWGKSTEKRREKKHFENSK